ncbi:hypothetical protein Prum_091900 [Phytohabitans rumicis]|uniref:Uncharacterized protein n=2 Tax=Phytohabitans rumicis TaxID=1076125 RepID=A0A6V8LKZ1_9ACTN|nr:hypothetical protein Prum_091900 [Phytohabitans rumicis]
MVLNGAEPFPERVRQVCAAWLRAGRDGDLLVTDKAFFTVYCWSHNHGIRDPAGPEYDPELAEYVTASYEALGGRAGWNAMLCQRTLCRVCGDRYLLENLGVCTGCMAYTCYRCGPHAHCTGELV